MKLGGGLQRCLDLDHLAPQKFEVRIPNEAYGLPLNETTLPSLLGRLGYRPRCGKHIGSWKMEQRVHASSASGVEAGHVRVASLQAWDFEV